jgi:hypothetical protein
LKAVNCDEPWHKHSDHGSVDRFTDPDVVSDAHMKSIDWSAITKDIERQVLDLAREIVGKYVDEASNDIKTFLENSKDSLERWSNLLAKGDLDRDEFQFLLKGQLDVAELHALKQAGLAKVKLDLFVKGVVKILTSVIASAAKGLV